ncbi:Retroviral aspartyl protease [Gimesia chilikensis]|uniref:PDZ domain-containing protein n=2 Tax=Gimesia TaxID=1649453 RepID=A0A6I6AHH1_9PLAN|nr:MULTISPECIES: aspartyl protease family protein [Gimesia]QDU05489.1 Retroviral aspartyl protease [Gimesia chilikensis]QGQ24685.1 PDZ domain-containing protein [Gimesia benthica]
MKRIYKARIRFILSIWNIIFLGIFPLNELMGDEELNLAPNRAALEYPVGKFGRPLLIPVTLNGRTISFLVDTGSSKSVFDKSLKAELGQPLEQNLIRTPGGRVSADLFKCPNAKIGNINLNFVGTIILSDLRPLRYATGEEIFGILGTDFLRKHIIEIDFDRGRFRIWSTFPRQWLNTSEKFPVSIQDGVPRVFADLPGNKSSSFIIDTGANASCLNKKIFDSLDKEGNLTFSASKRSFTLGGEIQSNSGYVKQLSVGPFVHQSVHLDRGSDSRFGLRYLSRYKVLIDFPKGDVYLQKSTKYSLPDSTATSGMSLIQIKGAKVVYAVKPKSPAGSSGVKPGDILVKINGRSCSDYDLFDLYGSCSDYDLFDLYELLTTKPGEVISLIFLRQDESRSVLIKLEKQISKITQ